MEFTDFSGIEEYESDNESNYNIEEKKILLDSYLINVIEYQISQKEYCNCFKIGRWIYCYKHKQYNNTLNYDDWLEQVQKENKENEIDEDEKKQYELNIIDILE